MEFAQFPKNLVYNMKTLSGFSKLTVVLTPDKYATVNNRDTINVKLPSNTIVDLRTFSMHFKGTTENPDAPAKKFTSPVFHHCNKYCRSIYQRDTYRKNR